MLPRQAIDSGTQAHNSKDLELLSPHGIQQESGILSQVPSFESPLTKDEHCVRTTEAERGTELMSLNVRPVQGRPSHIPEGLVVLLLPQHTPNSFGSYKVILRSDQK